MRSKLHKFRFQIAIVDEDNEGDSINEVWLEMKEWVGRKNFKEGLPEYLTEIDQFLTERNQTLAELDAGTAEIPEEFVDS